MKRRQPLIVVLLAAAAAALAGIAAAYMDPALRKAIAFAGLGLC